MIITDEYYQLDNNDLVHMVNKTYDQMGQLTQKSLHGSGGSFAQTVDYSYNIRGWMTHINNVNALGVDAFAMELSYNNCNEGYYNGNIWKQSWKSIQFANEKTYEYSYDGANRLISAAYDERSLDLSAGPYEYDLNGNITHLVRNGYYDQNGEIDNLTYQYEGNRLTRADDQQEGFYQAHGFSDNASFTADEYQYDANGNMTHDANKQLSNITYDHNNTPVHIELSDYYNFMIDYIYTADGEKLKKLSLKNYETVEDNNYITFYNFLVRFS